MPETTEGTLGGIEGRAGHPAGGVPGMLRRRGIRFDADAATDAAAHAAADMRSCRCLLASRWACWAVPCWATSRPGQAHISLEQTENSLPPSGVQVAALLP